jgi:hypothetical protein
VVGDVRLGGTREVAVIGRRHVAFAVALAGVVLPGAVTAATPDARRPFAYTFQVTSVTLTGTFTKGGATATTRLALGRRPKEKTLLWLGKGNYYPSNGLKNVVFTLSGEVVYEGSADPACDGTVQVDSSRWKGGIGANLSVDPVRTGRVRVDVGQLPLASIYQRRGGGCESGALTWWDDGAAKTYPLGLLNRGAWTFTARSSETFGDGSALVWTVTMRVKRTGYRQVDCERTQLC